MMTTKDYARIAEIIHHEYSFYDREPNRNIDACDGIKDVVYGLSESLYQDDPSLDREKFINACLEG